MLHTHTIELRTRILRNREELVLQKGRVEYPNFVHLGVNNRILLPELQDMFILDMLLVVEKVFFVLIYDDTTCHSLTTESVTMSPSKYPES